MAHVLSGNGGVLHFRGMTAEQAVEAAYIGHGGIGPRQRMPKLRYTKLFVYMGEYRSPRNDVN